MDSLRIDRSGYTLVDQVEEKLIQYFKEQGLRPGSSIPNENELAASLGIGRTVLREALSRFKMTGMIQSRTKRGMTLAEPSLLASLRRSMNPLLMSETTLRDIFEMRIILELGSADLVINLLSPQDIADLEQLVENEERFGDPYLTGFHRKLYENMGNKMMTEFQTLIIPVLEYVVEQHKPMFETRRAELAAKGKLVTHRDLLERIKAGDTEGYKEALKHHFDLYKDYLKRTRTDAEGLIREIIEALPELLFRLFRTVGCLVFAFRHRIQLIPHERLAQRSQAVGENNALDVVVFVLHRPGRPSFEHLLVLLKPLVEIAYPNLLRTVDILVQPRQRKAPLVHKHLLVRFLRYLRIDEHPFVTGRRRVILTERRSIHDEQPQRLADLRSGKPHPFRRIHRVEHVRHQLFQFGILPFHLHALLPQYGRTVYVNRIYHKTSICFSSLHTCGSP